MRFTFTGGQAKVYIDLQVDGHTLLAEPGQSYELEAAPDDAWTPASAPQPPQAVSEPPAAPAAPEIVTEASSDAVEG
jgi:hypothetical protein